jgi:hypothetical protein
MTKNEILTTIRQFAKKNDRNPNLRDVVLKTGITRHFVYHLFGSWKRALAEAGLEASGSGFGLKEPVLLLDWAGAVRKLKKIPSVYEYESVGRFSGVPFKSRYRLWWRVPEAFAALAQRDGLERDWQDVLALVARRREELREKESGQVKGRRSQKSIVFRNRPIYGRPLALPELAYEPVNEAGVVFAFGMVARRLGFTVHRIQVEFPDCEAMREVATGQWQRVRIEFEFESKNFLKHGHRTNGCDLIVCWSHNWPECPKRLEVIELKKVVRGLQGRLTAGSFTTDLHR